MYSPSGVRPLKGGNGTAPACEGGNVFLPVDSVEQTSTSAPVPCPCACVKNESCKNVSNFDGVCRTALGPTWTMCTSDQLLAQKHWERPPLSGGTPAPAWHRYKGIPVAGYWQGEEVAHTKNYNSNPDSGHGTSTLFGMKHHPTTSTPAPFTTFRPQATEVYCCNAMPLQCTAPPGTPAPINCTGIEDEEAVQGGLNQMCKPRQCTCVNGIPNVGSTCVHSGTEECAMCNPGYNNSGPMCHPSTGYQSPNCAATPKPADPSGTLCAAQPGYSSSAQCQPPGEEMCANCAGAAYPSNMIGEISESATKTNCMKAGYNRVCTQEEINQWILYNYNDMIGSYPWVKPSLCCEPSGVASQNICMQCKEGWYSPNGEQCQTCKCPTGYFLPPMEPCCLSNGIISGDDFMDTGTIGSTCGDTVPDLQEPILPRSSQPTSCTRN